MTEANSPGDLSGSCTTSFPADCENFRSLCFGSASRFAFVTLPFRPSSVNSFGQEFGKLSETKKDQRGQPVFEQAKEWRATAKPGRLYIHLFAWPKEFTLDGVKGKVTKAYLLADQKTLKFSQTGSKLVVQLPDKAPGELASVIRLDVSGANP